MVLTNPRYINLFSQSFQLAISEGAHLDAATVSVRVVQSIDACYAPAAGIVVLQGIA
jgi:hypothetical protein